MHKRLVPKILIALIIVNLFAPFTMGLSKKGNLAVSKSVAEAAITKGDITQTKRGENYVSIKITVNRETSVQHGFFYIVTDKKGTSLTPIVKHSGKNYTLSELVDEFGGSVNSQVTVTGILSSNKNVFVPAVDAKTIPLPDSSGLIPNVQLTGGTVTGKSADGDDIVTVSLERVISLPSPNTEYYISFWFFNGDKTPESIDSKLDIPLMTTAAGVTDDTVKNLSSISTTGPDGNLPACWLGLNDGGISMSGCIAQGVYYGLFIPTSYLFALTGLFFDSTFSYSVNDKSYRSPFVVEGWGIVRDFVNIFFIFVLIYIAFATILSLHGFKTKEMIINVIIIGLLMNFSLFAAQLIIDGSNILARVFYNSNAIKITEKGPDGVTKNTPGLAAGPNGELPLSAALVNKVNPQTLIINANSVGTIQDPGGRSSAEVDNSSGVSNGTFILIIILSIAINIVGMIVFLSVGLMCIARVVGLWIYMILAPLAFFSYTIPQMQGLKVIGWKNWWSQVLCMSFWAPIFIFFLYLILKFLETGLSLISAGSKTGLQFVISVVVPFAFIMILLWKAKDLAKSMGCEIAGEITGGIAAVGGMALGGAALGTAFLGRNIIGKGMAAASQSDSAKHLGTHKVALREFETKHKEWKKNGSIGPAPVKPTLSTTMANGKQYKPGLFTGLGASLNAKQKRVELADHEKHEIDAVKDKRYKGTEWNKLSGTQQNNVREDYIKENRGKHKDDVEEKLRSTGFGTGTPIPKDQALDENQREQVTNETTKVTGAKFDHALTEATKSIGGLNRVLAQVNTGSYDTRNLSQTKADKREGMFTKIGAGLIAGVAMGVRTGLKGSGVNHGSGQNDLLKDIGHTITEALKSTKINVKVEESHGKGGGDEHKGAGGHH